MSEVAMGFGTHSKVAALASVLVVLGGLSACGDNPGMAALPTTIAGSGALPTAGTGELPSAGTGELASAGTGAIAGMGGTAGSAGAAGTEGAAGSGMTGGPYMSLAPMPGEPFKPEAASMVTPAPPSGWSWYEVAGTFCRDGSKNGVYVRQTASDKLVIYFEGGGACTTKGFCHFNPANVDSVLSGDGQSVLGTTLAVAAGRQQPGVYSNGAVAGIFDDSNAANPYKGWNMVYIPYCTGDVHFGSNEAAMVPGVTEPQKFVGYINTRAFVSRMIPTFKDKVESIVVTGASAGSFGAALNMSMIADSFPDARIDAVLDSGVPFEDAHWPACLQQSWRDLFGLNKSLPADCKDCFNADGGNFLGLADFLIDKHPEGNIAIVSSIHDEVIRLFFAPGQNNCATIKTADPFEITLSQIGGGMIFPAADYEAGLMGLRAKYEDTNRMATYYMSGANATLHQHTFRARFYETAAGGKSIAQFTTDFLAGTMAQVGP